jgi:hypothetical protein
VRDYFPGLVADDRAVFPSLDAIAEVLGDLEVRPFPIPADCVDGFLGAFWRRPAAYLDPGVRAGMASFARVPDVAPRLERLRDDLASGAWAAPHGDLLARGAHDIGYRVVIGRCDGGGPRRLTADRVQRASAR